MEATNNQTTRLVLDTTPNLKGIVKNLGSSYANIAQPINELLDDSISALRDPSSAANPHLIRVTLREDGAMVRIRVEDTGSGIEDLENALRIAGDANRQTPLNEHGQGLDQTFSYIVENGGDWSLATRTADNCKNNEYLVVRAPFNKLDGTMEAEVLPGWDGLASTGTVIELHCPAALLTTLENGASGVLPFKRAVELLAESISFTYAQIIESNEVSIELVSIPASGKATRCTLKPLKPVWKSQPNLIKPVTVDLGGGDVTISGAYGETLPVPGSSYHYLANQETNGVFISINGRIVAEHLLKGIWRHTNHPSLNAFTVCIDLQTDTLGALPETTAEKTGFRSGNPILKNLYKYIRSTIQLPSQCRSKQEKTLFDRLEDELEKDPNCASIEREVLTFESLGLKERADLVMHDFCGGVHVFEGKARKSQSSDLYQLRMQTDGLIHSGISVLRSVLLAPEHTEEVRRLAAFLCTQTQEDALLYHIELKTWQDYGIDPTV